MCNGERFVGTWEGGVINGEGEVYRSNGKTWKTNWINGKVDPTYPDENGNITEEFSDSKGETYKYVG